MKLLQYLLMAWGCISLLFVLYFLGMYYVAGWKDWVDERREAK